MCYPCKHCGSCEKSKPKILGQCPICKTMNSPGDAICKECGFRFPALPGHSAAVFAGGGEALGEDASAIFTPKA